MASVARITALQINIAFTEGCLAIKVDATTGFSVAALKDVVLLEEKRHLDLVPSDSQLECRQ